MIEIHAVLHVLIDARALTWVLLTAISTGCDLAYARQPPDIVLIVSDDQGAYDVGWRGSEIETPNIDRLAESGAKLEQFYVQPTCSPTRAALMTGRYPMRYGLQVGVIRPSATYGLDLRERLLPQALREVGYTTAISGKWHLGSAASAYRPRSRGFDSAYGHLLGWIDYFTHRNNGELDWYREDLALQEPGYSTQLIADEAVRVIEAQQAGKPLFLYVAFNALHAPYQVPERYKYRYEKMKEPRRTYAGMLAAMDEAVGQIVAALERTKRRKNALFVFFSDNGGPEPGRLTDNGPWRGGKGTLYEGGVRVIATASWPGKIPAGSTVRSIIHVTDLFPTILRLAGASLDQRLPLDGVDVWPVLSQGKLSRRREVLLNTTPFSGALRIDDWKLVLNGDKFATSSDPAVELGVSMQEQGNAALAETVELFDLAADPYENSNIAAKQPDKLRELRQRYDLLAAQAAKPLNL